METNAVVIISSLLTIITTLGAGAFAWLLKRIDENNKQIATLQEERTQDKAEIAGLKAKVETLEDARKERDRLRGQLEHLERLLDRCWPAWRLEEEQHR